MELLTRFNAMSRTQIADLVCDGNIRAANRALLSLVKSKMLYRYTVRLHGECIYSRRKGPTGQTEHHLMISELYAKMMKTAVQPPVAEANSQLCKGLITDLLYVTDRFAIVTEVHRGTNPFGSKLAKYQEWVKSWRVHSDQRPVWWLPNLRVIVWVVAPAASVPWLNRHANQYRDMGLEVVVSSYDKASKEPWECLFPEAAKKSS